MEDYSPQFIAEQLDGRVVGDAEVSLTGLAEISDGKPGDLTFVGSASYAPRWAESGASAAIVTEGIQLEPGDGRALVFVKNADLAMARILELLTPEPACPPSGIHPTAVVDDTAEIAHDATIGAYCVIGPKAYVGPRCVLHNHVTLLDEAKVGEATVLWPNVVIRERCVIGKRCVLEPGCVIGADGFGYRPDQVDGVPKIVKIPHLGHVEIGDDVELGANVTIDRGKFAATTIGFGTKMDNQVQIGHNCKVGNLVVISGYTALAGSITVGDGALIGGGVNFRDHVTVGPGSKVGGGSVVGSDIPAGEEWMGYNANRAKDAIRELMGIRKLPKLLKDFKELKRRVDKLGSSPD